MPRKTPVGLLPGVHAAETPVRNSIEEKAAAWACLVRYGAIDCAPVIGLEAPHAST